MLREEKLPIEQIYVPVKRRASLDPDRVAQLAEQILEEGQQTPILVRRDTNRYVLVEGLHRLEACRALGESKITALLVHARR